MKMMNKCNKCDLCIRRTNIIAPIINVYSDILFISESPGHTEDKTNFAYASRSAKKFTQLVNEKLNEPASFTYLVKCKSHYKVSRDNIKRCNENLMNEINSIINLKTIVLIGQNVLNLYFNQELILKYFINKQLIDKDKRLILFMYHYKLLTNRNPKLKEYYVNQIDSIVSSHLKFTNII